MRTEGDLIEVNKWLSPLSFIYGMGVGMRNRMYELGIKKSRSFAIPVISVGNITVGGAGKTPHTEYLVRLLKDRMKVAVLSRGYKRKTKGYLLADKDSTSEDIGDEPRQMKTKFPDIYIAVDADRCEGIDRLTTDEATCDVDVILLDDAYQHRRVKPGIAASWSFARAGKGQRESRHGYYHKMSARPEAHGIPRTDKSDESPSLSRSLFHHH